LFLFVRLPAGLQLDHCRPVSFMVRGLWRPLLKRLGSAIFMDRLTIAILLWNVAAFVQPVLHPCQIYQQASANL